MYATPAKPGNVLTKGDPNSAVDAKTQTYFRSGVGKMIHMMQWSRPDICSAVRDLTRHMQQSIPAHIDAMHRVMAYCVRTRNRGATLKPNCEWNGKKDFKFTIGGRSDSDYATIIPIEFTFHSHYSISFSMTYKILHHFESGKLSCTSDK